MRGSDLKGKEVIELTHGERLGIIKECELLLNLNTGMVEGLILKQTGFAGLLKSEKLVTWAKIRKIGPELIIVEEVVTMTAESEGTIKFS
jgi:YlmC/YmxH family sporulation protein